MAALPETGSRQDSLYAEAAAMFGAALERLARAYERDTDRRLDLLQEVHIVYQLHIRGSAMSLPPDLMFRSALEFHCVQLVRQRDLLRSVWLWALLPLVPGMLVLQIGQALAHPERLSRIIAGGVVAAAVTAGIYELNRRAAAGIQERIDRLNEKL